MKKYIIILTAFLFLACDDFLDVIPTGSTIPVTVEDFDKLLNNKKIAHENWRNVMFMDPDWYLPGIEHYNGMYQPRTKKQYGWEEHHYEVQEQDIDWNNRYKHINVYNQIINEVDDAALGNLPESSRLLVKGEALAQRSMDFFLLINEYAEHYSAGSMDALGIPMPLKSDLTAQLPRSTVGEVYTQIIEDLLIAEGLLANIVPVNVGANFRPGIASIKALLGEIYLYMGDFAKAESYTSEALSMYYFVYDFHTVGFDIPGAPWWGFDVPEWRFTTGVKSSIWSRRNQSNFYDPASLFHPELRDLFNTTTDQRWRLFSYEYIYYDYNNAIPAPDAAYLREYAPTNAGMTVPRLVMSNAEAKARNGKGQEAIDLLNEFAVYRYTTGASTFTYSDDAAALQEVKDERHRELCYTGNNWFDLQRYHAYGETIPTYTRDIPGVGIITLEPGSDKYIVPIPRVVTNTNPNIN